MNKNNFGFTLIELLVVVAIIGVLSAIAIPMFNRYKENAQKTKVMAMTTNLYKAQEAYYVDNESYLSCTIDNGVSTCGALPGMGELNLVGYSAMNLLGTEGILVASCHVSSPKGYAIITDAALPFYEEGRMINFNLEIGECDLDVFALD